MSNLKAVPREIATGVLADFFREAHVASRPAVDSETLRQAAAPVTRNAVQDFRGRK